jgi:hypothetical protein
MANGTGAYTMRLRSGTYMVGVSVLSSQFVVPQQKVIAEEGKSYTVDFSLTPAPPDPAAMPVSGKVLDGEDRPVTGAVVLLLPAPGRPYAMTARDGSFAFPAVVGNHLLRAFAPNQQASTAKPQEVAAGQELVVHVQPWPTVSGIVRNKQGQPIAGARVTTLIETWPGAFSATTVSQTPMTDASGRYRAPVLYAGDRYRIRIVGPVGNYEYSAHESDPFDALRSGENHEAPDMVLLLADSFLAGRVVDEQGKPVKGSGVSIRGNESPGREVGCDPDGYFHLNWIANAEYELTASAGPLLKATQHVRAGTSDTVLILKPAAARTLPTTRPKTGGRD